MGTPSERPANESIIREESGGHLGGRTRGAWATPAPGPPPPRPRRVAGGGECVVSETHFPMRSRAIISRMHHLQLIQLRPRPGVTSAYASHVTPHTVCDVCCSRESKRASAASADGAPPPPPPAALCSGSKTCAQVNSITRSAPRLVFLARSLIP